MFIHVTLLIGNNLDFTVNEILWGSQSQLSNNYESQNIFITCHLDLESVYFLYSNIKTISFLDQSGSCGMFSGKTSFNSTLVN